MHPQVVDPLVSLNDFRIIVSTPRLILVTCLCSRFPVSICAAHAPHPDRPDAEGFWRELREALNRAPPTKDVKRESS